MGLLTHDGFQHANAVEIFVVVVAIPGPVYLCSCLLALIVWHHLIDLDRLYLLK